MKVLINLIFFNALADSIRDSLADVFADGEEFLS